MKIRPLAQADIIQWGQLLSICFNQSRENMIALLRWLDDLGELEAYGMWDHETLIAQYACLHRTLHLDTTPICVGMSMNMAVHPDYRGQGLIKQVSRPVYDSLSAREIMLGMGFSNAQGVKVDNNSKGYGYQVVGQMQPLITRLQPFSAPRLMLTDVLPESVEVQQPYHGSNIHFHKDGTYIRHRYARHPFRRYHYGIWWGTNRIHGMVIYKHVRLWGFRAVALLDVYGNDIEELIKRWLTTMHQQHIYLLHTLVSPVSITGEFLKTHGSTVKAPFTRTPYYLTVKPLHNFNDQLLDFRQWDLLGGDVL